MGEAGPRRLRPQCPVRLRGVLGAADAVRNPYSSDGEANRSCSTDMLNASLARVKNVGDACAADVSGASPLALAARRQSTVWGRGGQGVWYLAFPSSRKENQLRSCPIKIGGKERSKSLIVASWDVILVGGPGEYLFDMSTRRISAVLHEYHNCKLFLGGKRVGDHVVAGQCGADGVERGVFAHVGDSDVHDGLDQICRLILDRCIVREKPLPQLWNVGRIAEGDRNRRRGIL